MPALRDRVDDIALLAEHFLRRFGVSSVSLSPESIAFLQSRPWAGNVRELRNAIEHAGIVSRGGQILPEHFPPPIRTGGSETIGQRIGNLVHDWVKEQVQAAGTNEPAYLYDELLKVVEPALLDEVLRQLNGNRLATARWLGLARATLRKMMQKYRPDSETDLDT